MRVIQQEVPGPLEPQNPDSEETEYGSNATVLHEDIETILEPHVGFGDVYRSASHVQQNVGIQDVPSYSHDYVGPQDETRGVVDMSDVQIGDFFSRPVEIYSNTWGIGINLTDSFDPWSEFLGNKRVINRLTNYNFMRASLHVQFLINGNPFFFGRILASYLPFADLDDFSQRAGLVEANAVQETQCPHVFLDPSNSTGGTLRLPFFWHENSASIPTADWGLLGRVYLRTLNNLKHANGADEAVRISVFAWCENVTMAIPTSKDSIALVPQMGEIEEANTKGMISGPATAISRAAGELGAIPQIAPFARATEAGAKMVAGMAKAIGFSAPPVTRDPDPFKPVSVSSLAMTDVPQQLQRMTIDSQQELTIDPALAGLSRDDTLNIKNIVCKESYVTKFTWAVGAPKDTLLFNTIVDPGLYATSGVAPSPAYHFPATAFAALPFQYWTGSIKLRFQFVCSQYHRGRVRIVYEPNRIEDPSENAYNINYMEIVDLAEKNDFTMTIGPAQTKTYLEMVRPENVSGLAQVYGTVPLAATTYPFGNGVISLFVVNDLTVPNTVPNNDIEVNMYISAGKDFEVAVPIDAFQRYVLKPQMGQLEPQMGESEALPSMEEDAADMPECQPEEELGASSLTPNKNTNLVYIGETITSFRPLLKRFNLHSGLANLPTASKYLVSGRRPMFPYYRGNVAGAVDSTALLAPYSYCNTVLLHWIVAAHQGWRGSIRWKVIPRGKIVDSNYKIYVERNQTSYITRNYQQEVNIGPAYNNQSQANFSTVQGKATNTWPVNKFGPPTGTRGMCFTTADIQPNLEFEMPYYTNYRFIPGKIEDLTSVGLAPILVPTWDFRIFVEGDTSTAVDTYCAAGEDFQVFFFTGLPPLYYEEIPPIPAP